MTIHTKQYVIQKHAAPKETHWDFMLEVGDTLWTWRLNRPPEQIADQAIKAERIADHPKRFLTYEGPVQNRTGSVQIADSGTCRLEQTKNALHMELGGRILCGCFTLTQTQEDEWMLQKSPA